MASPGWPNVLDRTFYGRPAETVAWDLLGQILCKGDQRARIVETEAYVGPHDLACHARAGITRRTATIYGPPGHAYVYLVYGMHDMLNVVTGADRDGEAVLVRAAEPIEGIEGRTDGPGRLCKSMRISVATHNGIDLCDALGDLHIAAGHAPTTIATTSRIGVDYAGDWADAPLRFVDAASHHLSRPLPDADRPTTATGTTAAGTAPTAVH